MNRLGDVGYKLKRTGPRTDPCGTPNGMLILWYRFDKYELNHRRAVREIPKCRISFAKECHNHMYQTQQNDSIN